MKGASRMKLAIPDLVSNSYLPALAAVELGCFRDEGLDVEIAVIFPPNRAYEALRDGSVDLVAASAHTALAAFPGWEGVKLVCAQAQGMYWFLVLHADLGAERGDVSAVRGRSIGAAPWVELGLRGLLADAGLDPVRDDIRIAPVPKLADPNPHFGLSAAQALGERRIDGFWANGMAAEQAVRRGTGTVILDVRRGDGPAAAFRYTFAAVAAADRTLGADPDLAGRIRRAMDRTHAALRQDLSLATTVGRALFPPTEAEMIADLVRRDLPYYDSAVTAEDVAGMNRFARRLGFLDRDVPFERVVAA